jgi:Tfp pilus assembly protein PilX
MTALLITGVVVIVVLALIAMSGHTNRDDGKGGGGFTG